MKNCQPSQSMVLNGDSFAGCQQSQKGNCGCRILFVWTGLTGYMGDNWRSLGSLPGVELKIWIEIPCGQKDIAFKATRELKGLDAEAFRDDEPLDEKELVKAVEAFRPNVIFLTGWHMRLSRFVALHRSFSKISKVLNLDMPFTWSFRKMLAPIVLHSYLHHFCGTYVPGDDSARYARWLGFPRNRIYEGIYATDLKRFAPYVRQKLKKGIPHSFLYVGRYAKEKGLDILIGAYQRYRKTVDEPWPLDCAGMGPEEHLLEGVEGVQNLGFQSPGELAAIYGSHGVLVLASRFEPWGVVLAEAAGAAMPILCTDVCGARHEVVHKNGIVCKAGNVASLASAMIRIHRESDAALLVRANHSLRLAMPYACEAWASRTLKIVQDILQIK